LSKTRNKSPGKRRKSFRGREKGRWGKGLQKPTTKRDPKRESAEKLDTLKGATGGYWGERTKWGGELKGHKKKEKSAAAWTDSIPNSATARLLSKQVYRLKKKKMQKRAREKKTFVRIADSKNLRLAQEKEGELRV